MRKRFNKLIAAFLVVVLSVAFVPLAAIAIDGAEEAIDETPVTEVVTPSTEVSTDVSGTADTTETTPDDAVESDETTESNGDEGGYDNKEEQLGGGNFGGGNGNGEGEGGDEGDGNNEGTDPVDTDTVVIELNFAYLENASEIPQNAQLSYTLNYKDAADNNSVSGVLSLGAADKIDDTTYQWSIDHTVLPSDLAASGECNWTITQSNLAVDGYVLAFNKKLSGNPSVDTDAKRGTINTTLAGSLAASPGKIAVYAGYYVPYNAVHYYYDHVTETEEGNVLDPDDYLNEGAIIGTKDGLKNGVLLVYPPVVSGSTVSGIITQALDEVPDYIEGSFKIQKVPTSFVVTRDTTTKSKSKEFYFYYVRTLKVIWIDSFEGGNTVLKTINDWVKGETVTSDLYPEVPQHEGYKCTWVPDQDADGNVIIRATWEKTDNPNPPAPVDPDVSTGEIVSPSAGSGSGSGITRPTQTVYIGSNNGNNATTTEEAVTEEATPLAAPTATPEPQQISDDETPMAPGSETTVPSIEYTVMLLGFLLIFAFGVAAVVRRMRDEHNKSAIERTLLS